MAAPVHNEEETLGKVYDARIMRRVFAYVRPHRRLVALAFLLLLVGSAAQLAQPYLIKVAIDGPIANKDPGGLVAIVIAFAFLLVAEFMLRFAQIYILEKIGWNVVYDLRRAVYDHLQSLASSFFDRNPVGRLVTRVTTDIESLSELFASGVVTLLGDCVKLIGIVVILFWMDVRLATLTVTVLPLLGVGTFFFRLRIRDAFRQVRTRLARLHAALHETLTGMTIIQLFRHERANASEFEQINRAHRDAELSSVSYDSVFSAMIELVGSLTVAMIIWYGGARTLGGALTFGTLVAFLEYAQKFFGPIRELGSFYSVMQSAMASSERIFALLDTKPGILSPAKPRPIPCTPRPESPRWSSTTSTSRTGDGPPAGERKCSRQRKCYGPLFRDPGERVALVGSTGAGKSTIARLLIRLYDVDRGVIRVNGIDIRELDPRVLRRKVALVMQDQFLFAGTIAANISLSDPAITAERIQEAARAVRAEPFIMSLPRGYDSAVAERGSNFSVGQKQLFALARVLAFDPAVLVLDEATASVDSETERHIQEALHAVMEARSSLVIAHRLSTIRESHRILVMHHGKVREEGTHEELLAQDGIYERLYQLQYPRSGRPIRLACGRARAASCRSAGW